MNKATKTSTMIGNIIRPALAGMLLLASAVTGWTADQQPISIDIDLVGANPSAQGITPPEKVPQSMALSQAREVYDNSMNIAGFNNLGAFHDIYPGINMACYADEHQFEFAFTLKPGADPSRIRLQLEGFHTIGTTDQGNIIYKRDNCEVYERAPSASYHDKNGNRPVHSSANMAGDGSSTVNITDFFDLHADKMNKTRFNIIPADSARFGPDYDFYMAKYETTNDQLIRFLNSAESNTNNAFGANMFFDKSGNIWINPKMQPHRDEMFSIAKSKILYNPQRVVGDRYYHIMDSHNNVPYAQHPATGLSWYGGVKYSNWLTLNAKRGLSELCYTEGTNTWDWAPVTATNWINGSFTPEERSQWLKLKGFRLPMFETFDPAHDNSPTNSFNEFLKAGSWNGKTNVLYGYGRNVFTNTDANALNTLRPAIHTTMPVGFFDGYNKLHGERTRKNNNYFGIYDLSGNVGEWVNDPPRPGAAEARVVCGGSYSALIEPLTEEKIAPPYDCSDSGGIRPVTTYMEDSYVNFSILFCFHVPPPEDEIKKEEKHGEKQSTSAEGIPTATDISRPYLPPPSQGVVTDPNNFKPKPPEPEPTPEPEPGPTPGPGPGPGPGPEPEPPIPYELLVESRNPDFNVQIAINNPDIYGNTDGKSTITRYYNHGESVSATAPGVTDNNQFQYWERNGSPATTHNTIDVEMLSNQNITAVYLEFVPPTEYTLRVNSTPANGVPITISTTDNNGETDGNTEFSRIYDSGTHVTATAPATHNGLQFRQWLLNGRPFSTSQTVSVAMLNDMTLTAAYGPPEPGRQLTVNSINPDSGVPIDVSIPDNNGDQNGNTTFTRHYDTDTQVTLVAPPITNKVFRYWLRNGVVHTTDPTVTVELRTDIIMTAVYENKITEVILTVHSSNPDSGVPIRIGTPDNDGKTDGDTSFTRRYNIGTPTTATAPSIAPNGNEFVQWVMNGVPLSTNLTVSVNMLANTELIAAYRTPTVPQTFELNVLSQNPDSGVAITVTTPDINGNTDGTTAFNRTYNEGEATTLTAPETTSGGTKTFDHWLIDGHRYDTRSIDVLMNANHTVTAIYVDTPPPQRYVLTVQSRNPNSSVVIKVDPADVNGQQNGTTTFTRLYDDGEHVTLTASNPAFPGSGNTFKYWLLDGSPWLSDQTVSVDMTRNITVTAVYGTVDTNPHTLTVQSQNPDSGVDIIISQTDTNGLANGTTEFQRTYPHGTSVSATAPEFAPNGYKFKEWLLGGVSYTSDQTIDLSILGDMTITAVYEPYITHTLTVQSENPDSGVDITVTTPDINGGTDGSTTFQRIYEHGTPTSLTAPHTAPNGRDIFQGWSRDGSIFSTNTTINLTIYDDTTVTAIYGHPDTFDLTINSENPDRHVTVSVTTPDINGNTDGDTTFVRTYNPGQNTTITAPQTAPNGNTFIEWRRNGITLTTNLSVNVSMLSDLEMTAVYGENQDYRLLSVRSVNPDSGVPITISLPDLQGRTDGETAFPRLYNNGDSVTATAPLNAGGNEFKQWFIDGTPYTTNRTITVQMWVDHEIVAEYGPPPVNQDVSLYVNSINPNSGVPIEVSKVDNNGLQNGETVFIRTYTRGDATTLVAPEQGGTNNTYFSHWERDGSHYSDNRTVTVEMLTDVHMTAVYDNAPPPINLTVNAKTEDGIPISTIIGVAPADLNGEAVGTTEFQRLYNYGTTATLDAPATADGETFLHWEQNGVPLSTNRNINIELLADITLTAVYGTGTQPTDVTLTVKSEGPDGSLSTFITVTPDNNGAAGGTTTFERHYGVNSSVTLDAPHSNGDLRFDHWERNGVPFAPQGQETITFDMLSDNTVTAVYVNKPPTLGEDNL